MGIREPFQPDREPDITTSDDILNLELLKLGVKPEFLNDPRVFSGSETRVVLRLGSGHDHLTRGEDQGGRLRIPDSHDNSGKTLTYRKSERATRI
jgi:hypothetical protein